LQKLHVNWVGRQRTRAQSARKRGERGEAAKDATEFGRHDLRPAQPQSRGWDAQCDRSRHRRNGVLAYVLRTPRLLLFAHSGRETLLLGCIGANSHACFKVRH
jgi:hypothetical protein